MEELGTLAAHSASERLQPRLVQRLVDAQASAHVEAVWLHRLDCRARVGRVQAASKPHWHSCQLHDSSTVGPVVEAARAAQLLDGERGVAGIQQQLVDEGRGLQRLLHG